ncbi:MAG TPA: outer membrane protein assembly factor BamE [Geminicoccaceae bacterium]|nr:outer membrane protein assembly factor BamE [Geminicoccaceae bacterium]
MKAMLPRTCLAAALCAAVALGACTPTTVTHGHRIDAELLSQITPGVTSREEVARLLGSPSSMSTFNADEWYYISQRTERRSFYQSDITAQDVVAITFDPVGIVSSVNQHGLDQAMAVAPSPDKTATLGNELTLIQQLLGNVGRFNTNPDPAIRPQAPGPGRR